LEDIAWEVECKTHVNLKQSQEWRGKGLIPLLFLETGFQTFAITKVTRVDKFTTHT
jgi:hypothetical protein